jgi:hypothetical protein
MSLFALPVTVADLTQLQQGEEFFTNTAEATAQAALINASTPGVTVFSYSNQIILNNQALSQVVMAVDSLMFGQVDTIAEMTKLATQFLPPQLSFAVTNGFRPDVFDAEAVGFVLASGNGSSNAFATTYGTLSVSAFAQAVSTAVFGNTNLTSAIVGYVNNWVAFYTAHPSATFGQTVTLASYGAAFGDAVGLAIDNPTTVGAFLFGQVSNALVDNAEGLLKVGTALGLQPIHTPLQGDTTTPPNVFTLTPNIDNFSTALPGAIFNALPVVTALGIAVNTLNAGDTLTAPGDGTLNDLTATLTIGANPAFATNVTMNGISTANITGTSGALTGFQGNITGLKVININNSTDAVQVGGPSQGLNTLPTNLNINNYGCSLDEAITVLVAQPAADLTKTINISLTGRNVGGTAAGKALDIIVANDTTSGGTAATPNNSYGTWAITSNVTANLELDQDFADTGIPGGGVGGATSLVLAGSGAFAVGQDAAGDWQLLKTIDTSKATGKVVITGATSFIGSTNAFVTAANPGWLFGAEGAGLLDDTGGTFALTSIVLGSGLTIVDASSASATKMAALTTGPGAGVTVSAGNEFIVKDSVATTTTTATFATIAGFSTLGIGGPAGADGAGGTINMANLPASINILDYVTFSSAALTINNQTAALTVNTEDNGGGNAITVKGPAGFADSFHLIIGDTFHTVPTAGSVGALTLTGDEVVTISSVGASGNLLGYVSLTPTVGGDEHVTIDGNKSITIGVTGTGGIADVNSAGALIANNLTITITDTGVVRLLSSTGGVAALDLAVPGDPADGSGGAFPLTNSTNARLIDASASGGLIMNGGDANFVTSATVAGSTGSVLIGSATAGNVLGGSIGNDVFTLNNAGLADTVFTGGGADPITLVAGHTAANSLDMYSGFSTTGVTPGNAEIVRFASITDAHDVAELGWFGQATGIIATGYNATGLVYAGLAANTATAADMSTVANFNTGSDIIQLSDGFSGYGVGVHGANGVGGGVTLQLVFGDLATNPFATGLNGTAVVAQNVEGSAAPSVANTVLAGTDLIKLDGQTFSSAQTVVNYLQNPTTNVHFSGALAFDNSAHVYVAWQDFSGNTDIADLALIANGAASADTSTMTEHLSVITQLMGVALSSVTGTDVHLMHG